MQGKCNVASATIYLQLSCTKFPRRVDRKTFESYFSVCIFPSPISFTAEILNDIINRYTTAITTPMFFPSQLLTLFSFDFPGLINEIYLFCPH